MSLKSVYMSSCGGGCGGKSRSALHDPALGGIMRPHGCACFAQCQKLHHMACRATSRPLQLRQQIMRSLW